ncbi:MAG: TonB-dependent receptor, partial [Chitinophagaceae bacterium]|nr:TonB-dependent receptor [Chitinophagaceae bacterium]
MKPLLFVCYCLLLTTLSVNAQDKPAKAAPGLVTGNVIDTLQKAVADATVMLRPFNDSLPTRNTRTDKDGNFEFENLPFGYYKLSISYVSFRPLTLDSIWIRAERYDFNLNDLVLKPNTDSALEEVVVYAEKPLIESRDGNITFNAGESALSAGSNAAELLKNVPLVANDPDGKLVVRGKEPKILIDDKPVELNAQQLADLLESLPGSMIEKIEVMTNPPPQYANESGGVINIVTKKGKVGMGARLTLTAGSRGEYG